MAVGEWIHKTMLIVWISFDISIRFTYYFMVHNDYQCLQGSRFRFELIQDAPAISLLAKGRHNLSQRTPQSLPEDAAIVTARPFPLAKNNDLFIFRQRKLPSSYD